MLNFDFIRSQFPGLNTDWVLFDNAGGSQIAKPVVDRINDHFYTSNVQLGGTYKQSVLAEERHIAAHSKLATWINADSSDELILGPSTSMLIRNLAENFRQEWKKGDEVIVTNCDHEANIGAWREMAHYGIIIKEWRVNPETLRLQQEDLKNLLSDKTKMVAFTASSNVLGQINSVKEFTAIAHEYNAMVCVDAVAYAPHCLIDVKDTKVDFLVFSFYKTYGPHYAMMYGKQAILNSLPGINHFFIKESPYKFQPGNYNFEFCYGMSALPEYFRNLAELHNYNGNDNIRKKLKFIYDLIAEHEEKMSEMVLAYLSNKKGIRIIGPSEHSREIRVPTISFIKEGTDSQQITLKTDKHKVAIRWGDFYARRLINDLGLDKNNGVVRISMVHYNTFKEIDRLINALDYAI